MSQMLNATAVIELTESNVDFLRKIQLNHPIPDGATHIAFLEDGDATFLSEFKPTGSFSDVLGSMHIVRIYTDVPIEFED